MDRSTVLRRSAATTDVLAPLSWYCQSKNRSPERERLANAWQVARWHGTSLGCTAVRLRRTHLFHGAPIATFCNSPCSAWGCEPLRAPDPPRVSDSARSVLRRRW